MITTVSRRYNLETLFREVTTDQYLLRVQCVVRNLKRNSVTLTLSDPVFSSYRSHYLVETRNCQEDLELGECVGLNTSRRFCEVGSTSGGVAKRSQRLEKRLSANSSPRNRGAGTCLMNTIMSTSVMYEHQAIYGYECKEDQTNQGTAHLPGGEYPAITVNSGTLPGLGAKSCRSIKNSQASELYAKVSSDLYE